MKTVTIESHRDITGHHLIQTREGINLLNSLINNHPLTVIEFLNEGGYDALINFILKREQAYHDLLKEDPNNIDGAIDTLYGTYKCDSELDQQVEGLEEELYVVNEHLLSVGEKDLITYEEEQELSDHEAADLWEERYNQACHELEVKKLAIQVNLEEIRNGKEKMSPIKLDFIPYTNMN